MGIHLIVSARCVQFWVSFLLLILYSIMTICKVHPKVIRIRLIIWYVKLDSLEQNFSLSGHVFIWNIRVRVYHGALENPQHYLHKTVQMPRWLYWTMCLRYRSAHTHKGNWNEDFHRLRARLFPPYIFTIIETILYIFDTPVGVREHSLFDEARVKN